MGSGFNPPKLDRGFQNDVIKKTSIPLPGGGDTHIHPFGRGQNDFVITTRIPGHKRGIHDDSPWLPRK